MDIQSVCGIIHKIAEGFEDNALRCLDNYSGVVVVEIQEQLICGQDGDGKLLSPTYDDDPFFDEEGPWQGRSGEYKAWKHSITPPRGSKLLDLPPRPDNVPNLYITGKFHGEITASLDKDELLIDPGKGDGPDIVSKYRKYGHDILGMGPSSVTYFNREYMMPAIEKFFKDCGYR